MLPVLLRVHAVFAVCIGLISSSPHPYSPAPQERAAYVKEFKQCTESNVDDIITLLPDELWGAYMCHRGHRCIDILKLMPACPWGPPVAESLPMIHIMIIDSGDYAGDPIRGFFDYSSGFGEGCA